MTQHEDAPPRDLPYLVCREVVSYAFEMPERQSADPKNDLVILGARITRAREGKGLSKTDVARELRVRNATVGDWEAGRYMPRGQSVRQLAELLGMTSDELLDVMGGAPPPFAAWEEMLAAHPEMTHDEREFLRRLPWPGDREPGLAQYEIGLMMLRGARPRP